MLANDVSVVIAQTGGRVGTAGRDGNSGEGGGAAWVGTAAVAHVLLVPQTLLQDIPLARRRRTARGGMQPWPPGSHRSTRLRAPRQRPPTADGGVRAEHGRRLPLDGLEVVARLALLFSVPASGALPPLWAATAKPLRSGPPLTLAPATLARRSAAGGAHAERAGAAEELAAVDPPLGERGEELVKRSRNLTHDPKTILPGNPPLTGEHGSNTVNISALAVPDAASGAGGNESPARGHA